MSFWSTLPFIRIVLFFIGGIVWNYYTQLSYSWLWSLFTGTSSLYGILIIWKFPYTKLSTVSLQGIIGLMSMFLAGSLCCANHHEKDTLRKTEEKLDILTAYVGIIADEPSLYKGQPLQATMIIQQACIAGKWEKVTSKIKITIQRLNNPTALMHRGLYLVLGKPKLINNAPNPNTFDYKSYLSQEQIYYHHIIPKTAIKKIGYLPAPAFNVLLLKLRSLSKKMLSHPIQAKREGSIILALVIGIKDKLADTVRDAYAATGTMHVLAVSGLHVGILYMLLNFILYKGNKSNKKSWLATGFILLCLWLYAGITGFSPSVFRATLMLSFITWGRLLGQKTATYNVLAASAFFILLVNPLWIFSISFQLSYAAVLGIVYLQPRIYKVWQPKNIILRKLWLWSSLSLGAQTATLFMSLYYFHQFPTYFIIANWIVVPAAFCIFTLGLMVLLASFSTNLQAFLGHALEQLTWYTNEFVRLIQRWPHSAIDNIYINLDEVFLWYGLLILMLIGWNQKSFSAIFLSIMVCTFLLFRTTYQAWQYYQQKGVRIYSIPTHSAIAFVKRSYCLLLVDNALYKDSKKINNQIKPDLLVNGISACDIHTFEEAQAIKYLPLQNWHGLQVGVWNHKKWIIINEPPQNWPYLKQKYYVNYLVITNNKVNSLERLLKQFEWEYLIIDSSNSKKLALKLQREAQRYGLKSPISLHDSWWSTNSPHKNLYNPVG